MKNALWLPGFLLVTAFGFKAPEVANKQQSVATDSTTLRSFSDPDNIRVIGGSNLTGPIWATVMESTGTIAISDEVLVEAGDTVKFSFLPNTAYVIRARSNIGTVTLSPVFEVPEWWENEYYYSRWHWVNEPDGDNQLTIYTPDFLFGVPWGE